MGGVVNTITTMGGGNREPKVFCNVNPSGNGMNGNVYTGDLSPTLTTNKGEGVKILEPQIIAQRGRNPYNPKLKSPGSKTVQMFEKGPEGLSNTLTTIQKDNMLLEPTVLQTPRGYNKGSELEMRPSITSSSWQENNYLKILEATEKGYAEACDGGGVYLNRPHQKRGVVQKGLNQTLKTSGSDVGVVISDQSVIAKLHPNRGCIIIDELVYWIRKLIPRECMRLMGANDAQIDRQLEVVSNSQAYKQAGNGIVAQVIGLIIGMLYYEDELELRSIVMKNSHGWVRGRV